MAEDTINKAFKKFRPCKTKNLSLHKSPPFANLAESVRLAVEEEMALTAADILARRTRTLFLDAKEALALAPEVIRLMEPLLKKNSLWGDRELKTFTEYAKIYCI